MNKMKYKNGGHDYAGDTESTSARRRIKKGRKGRKEQKERVLDVSSRQKEDFTKKQKRATKRIMRKSDRMYKAEERQAKREARTGSKHGKGIIGKVREKVSGISKKRRTKGINRNMDKLTERQAFNVGRRYTPGKTYMYKGEERSEKLRPPKKDTPVKQDQDTREEKRFPFLLSNIKKGAEKTIGNIKKAVTRKKQDGGEFIPDERYPIKEQVRQEKYKRADKSTFKKAFRAARNAGKKTFMWKGKAYNTKLKEEVKKGKKGWSAAALVPKAGKKGSKPDGSKSFKQTGGFLEPATPILFED